MDDRRPIDPRINGNAQRNSPLTDGTAMFHGRQTGAQDPESVDLSQFRLTRILGEAMFQYSRLKDAEHEARNAEGDYARQTQYFDVNPKLKETIEYRKNKSERNYSTVRADYARAAKEAEPLLRRLNMETMPPKDTSRLDEEMIKKAVQQELRATERAFVRFRDLEIELETVNKKLFREFARMDDVKSMLKRYAFRNDHENLAEQVRGLSAHARQTSVSSDTSRDLDQRLAQNREFDQLTAEFRTKQDQLSNELTILRGLFNSLQRGLNSQPSRRLSLGNGKSNDVVKVEEALEKAQEVINDQYVTIQDLQLQVQSVTEGVRILNEHIEEYDKRLDGLQSSTDKFFNEVQAESGKRDTIICQALDTMHDKIASEISAIKLDGSVSPASGTFNDSPRMGMPSSFPSNNTAHLNLSTLAAVNQQLDIQAKLVHDLQVRVNHQHTQIMGYTHHAQNVLPNRVQQFCDDVSNRLHAYQRDQVHLQAQITMLDTAFKNTNAALQKHVANSDNNFKETAMHMDSVKKRFAEHRKQLETLITAVKDIAPKTDQLIMKYDQIKEYLSTRILQRIIKIENAFPEVFWEQNQLTAMGSRHGSAAPPAAPSAAPAQLTDGRRGSQEGIGGADDPIEV